MVLKFVEKRTAHWGFDNQVISSASDMLQVKKNLNEICCLEDLLCYVVSATQHSSLCYFNRLIKGKGLLCDDAPLPLTQTLFSLNRVQGLLYLPSDKVLFRARELEAYFREIFSETYADNQRFIYNAILTLYFDRNIGRLKFLKKKDVEALKNELCDLFNSIRAINKKLYDLTNVFAHEKLDYLPGRDFIILRHKLKELTGEISRISGELNDKKYIIVIGEARDKKWRIPVEDGYELGATFNAESAISEFVKNLEAVRTQKGFSRNRGIHFNSGVMMLFCLFHRMASQTLHADNLPAPPFGLMDVDFQDGKFSKNDELPAQMVYQVLTLLGHDVTGGILSIVNGAIEVERKKTNSAKNQTINTYEIPILTEDDFFNDKGLSFSSYPTPEWIKTDEEIDFQAVKDTVSLLTGEVWTEKSELVNTFRSNRDYYKLFVHFADKVCNERPGTKEEYENIVELFKKSLEKNS